LSTNRRDFGVLFEVHVASTKTFEFTVIDPDTGTFRDLTDTNVYATALVKIVKPDGTQIASNITVSFTNRAAGIVEFTVSNTHTAAANAGNWVGELEISSITPNVIDQQFFNFNILESN